jgi:spore coat polysaccharide biosynthesis protein SpsF
MEQKVLGVIQARTRSTRLPGKVMYPLGNRAALAQVINRVSYANKITDTVVATSTGSQDNVLAQYVPKFGVNVIRGSESDVLSRFECAVKEYDPDIVVRITGDCPLVDPETIDRVIISLIDSKTEYASNISERTFPRGLDVEAFTPGSFERVISEATTQAEREHVTPYYRQNAGEFNVTNITSDQVFESEQYIDRTDLRLTLDEADDYRLLNQVYEHLEYDEILPIKDAIKLIDKQNLNEINESVQQKKM